MSKKINKEMGSWILTSKAEISSSFRSYRWIFEKQKKNPPMWWETYSRKFLFDTKIGVRNQSFAFCQGHP